MGVDNHAEIRAAFLVVWSDHKERLFRLCLRWMGGDSEAARDAVAQVALKAIEELTSGHVPIANYAAWLTRMARNVCIDVHRERAAGNRAIDRFGADGIQEDVEHCESPESKELRRELGERIREAIERLPPRLLAVVRLRFLEDAAYEDIAERLEVSDATARKRIQDARDILCEELSSYLCNGTKTKTSARFDISMDRNAFVARAWRRRGRRKREPSSNSSDDDSSAVD